MNADMIPFAFEENLVRVVRRADEPWFVGADVCHCLGLAKGHSSLQLLDDDERGSHTVGTPGGEQSAIIVSEPGVYRLIFRSRKPEAERFKRWLAHDVLPALRKTGAYAVPGADHPGVTGKLSTPRDMTGEPLLHRLYLLDRVIRLYGRAVGQSMYRQLGLPPVPPPPLTDQDEARQCLRHLLDTLAPSGRPARDLIEQALDDDEEARIMLLAAGVRVYPERDGFTIANQFPNIGNVFQATDWNRGRYVRVLRRLPGSEPQGPQRHGPLMRRSTFLPAHYLDQGS